MKLETNNTEVEVVGGSKSSSFSIAMNAKAFRVLSDTLYQNKIGSIVREICCNAYDAHVAAGHPSKPFEVHLPDAFEPWFAVKDYGTGLSPKEVRSVLTVYFESTKDQSNDSIGAFGLGAKTPFSYTDQFTVTSVKNGQKHIYSAFISSSGVPDIIEMHKEATTEPNGVEVKVSVKREDYSRFKSELQSQLQFFKVRPEVNHSVNYDTFTSTEIDTNDVSIGQSGGGYNRVWIVQGNVGYILDLSQLEKKINSDAMEFLKAISSRTVCLYFNIGEIGVTASREGVEYNASTVKNIEAKILKIKSDIAAIVQKDVDACANDWEKAKYINTHAVARLVTTKFKITSAEVRGGMWTFPLHKIIWKNGKIVNATQTTPSEQIGTLRTINRWYSTRPGVSITGEYFVSPDATPSTQDGAVIFLKDKVTNCNKKIKQYLSKNSTDEVFELVMNDGVYDQALIDKITATLGGVAQVVKLSDIELPKSTATRAKSTIATYYTMDFNTAEVRNWAKQHDKLTELDEDVVYVIVDNLVPSDADSLAIRQFISFKTITDDVPDLIAIREKSKDKIDGMSNFVKLQDYIKEKQVEYDKPEVKALYDKKKFVEGVDNIFDYRDFDGLEKIKKLAPDSEYVKSLSLVKDAMKKYSQSKEAIKNAHIATFIGYQPDLTKIEKRIAKIKAKRIKLLDKYPLMKVKSDYTIKNSFTDKALSEYLKAMEFYYKNKP